MTALRKFDGDSESIADLVAGVPEPSDEQMRIGELALDAFYDGTKDADVQSACAYVYRAMRALEPFQPTTISAKAREWAGHYPASSDGRNTFILFAEWVEKEFGKFSGGTCSGGE